MSGDTSPDQSSRDAGDRHHHQHAHHRQHGGHQQHPGQPQDGDHHYHYHGHADGGQPAHRPAAQGEVCTFVRQLIDGLDIRIPCDPTRRDDG
eukprot:4883586-Prymnesium_polylepis.2